MKQFLPLCCLLLLLTGCSKSTVPGPTDAEKGSIRFDCNISAQVTTIQDGNTKADQATRELPASCLPDANQMKLHLTGTSTATEYHYENMAAYDQPLLDLMTIQPTSRTEIPKRKDLKLLILKARLHAP